jgi:hypothetical protein
MEVEGAKRPDDRHDYAEKPPDKAKRRCLSSVRDQEMTQLFYHIKEHGAMESYTRCLLRHKGTHLFIARSYDTATRRMETSKTMKGALRFADTSDASEWLLNAPTAPQETDQYEYVTIRISIAEEDPYGLETQLIPEDKQGHAGGGLPLQR